MSRQIRPNSNNAQWGAVSVILTVAIIAVVAILAAYQRDPSQTLYNQTYVEHNSFDDYYVYNASEAAVTPLFILAHITRLDLQWFNTTDNVTYGESTTALVDVLILMGADHPAYFAVVCYIDSARPLPMTNISLTIYWNASAAFQPDLVSRTAVFMGTFNDGTYLLWIWNEYEVAWRDPP